jgi:hypothetical protein
MDCCRDTLSDGSVVIALIGRDLAAKDSADPDGLDEDHLARDQVDAVEQKAQGGRRRGGLLDGEAIRHRPGLCKPALDDLKTEP